MSKILLRFLSALAGCAAFVASTAVAPSADACTPIPQGWMASLANTTVPANGVLVVTSRCFSSCAESGAPSVSVREAAGDQGVPGTLSEIGSSGEDQLVFAWRPFAAFEEGQYRIDLPGPEGSRHSIDFEVVSALDAEPPAPAVAGLAQIYGADEGERICCPTGPLDSCGGHSCYSTLTRRSVMVDLDWSSTESAAKLGQYLHRVSWEGAPRGPIEPSWQVGPAARAMFDAAEDEYCYTLELKSLIDGEVTVLPRACVAHPSGGVTGVFDRDPAEIRNALGLCEAPPEGLANPWCGARAERCAQFPTNSCEGLDTLCSEEPVDPPPQGGAGGETTAPAPQPGDPEDSGGCSVVSAGISSQAGWLVAALAWLGVCRRRAGVARTSRT